jgi:hypothetical protein
MKPSQIVVGFLVVLFASASISVGAIEEVSKVPLPTASSQQQDAREVGFATWLAQQELSAQPAAIAPRLPCGSPLCRNCLYGCCPLPSGQCTCCGPDDALSGSRFQCSLETHEPRSIAEPKSGPRPD